MDWKDALSGLLPEDYQPEEEPAAAAEEKQNGRLDVVLDRKGRGGKVATIISGFTLGDEAVAQLAATLKKRLGTGGSARGGEILIQGDRVAAVLAALQALGYKARKI